MKNRTIMIGYDDISPFPGHTICFELYSLIVAAVKDELIRDLSYHLVPGHSHNNLGILLKVYQYTCHVLYLLISVVILPKSASAVCHNYIQSII